MSAIIGMAYQEEPTPIIWTVLANGGLLSCTYRRTSVMGSSPPEFYAWARHSTAAISASGITEMIMSVAASATLGVVTLVNKEWSDNWPTYGAGFVDLNSPITGAQPSAMTASFTLYGLQNKVGQTVVANIAGLYAGSYTVAANGSVTIPWQSDPDKLLTADYLIAADAAAPAEGWGPSSTTLWVYNDSPDLVKVTISAVVGYAYQTQGQRVRSNEQNEAKTRQGSALGMLRKAYEFSALFTAAVNSDLEFGTSFTNATPVALYEKDLVTPLDNHTVFNGVYNAPLDDESSFDGQLCWQQSYPFPLVISSVSTFMEFEER